MKHIARWGLLLGLAGTTTLVAAQDAEGCKDHPLFNRIKGYEINECQDVSFDSQRFPVGLAASGGESAFRFETVEGHKTFIRYARPEGVAQASPLQVIRNFQNAVKAAGGELRGEFQHGDQDLSEIDGGERAATLVLRKGGREAWALVSVESEGAYYLLRIIEREAMQQEIVANQLLDRINQDGFVAIDVLFDTGKATIKAESNKLLDEVAGALKTAAALKLEVAGHTDNVGTPEVNQKLSEDRAKSVAAALVARGIAAERLTSKGYGQGKPVADNRTEAGRAKNRRVELVKR